MKFYTRRHLNRTEKAFLVAWVTAILLATAAWLMESDIGLLGVIGVSATLYYLQGRWLKTGGKNEG